MATPTGSASMGTANGNPNRGWESAVFSWPASYDHDHTSLNGDLNNYTPDRSSDQCRWENALKHPERGAIKNRTEETNDRS